MSAGVLHLTWVVDGLAGAGTVCGRFNEGDGRTWLLQRDAKRYCIDCLAHIADWTVEAATWAHEVVGAYPATSVSSMRTADIFVTVQTVQATQRPDGSVALRSVIGGEPFVVPLYECDRVGSFLTVAGGRRPEIHAPRIIPNGTRVRASRYLQNGASWTADARRERSCVFESQMALERGGNVAWIGRVIGHEAAHGLCYRVCFSAKPVCAGAQCGEDAWVDQIEVEQEI